MSLHALREPTKFSEGNPHIYSGEDAVKIGGTRTKFTGGYEVLAARGTSPLRKICERTFRERSWNETCRKLCKGMQEPSSHVKS